MAPHPDAGFELEARMEAESCHVMWLGLCELRLVNDRRWPWLLLVPQRNGVVDLHELTPLDQTMVTFEINDVSEALKREAGSDTIEIGKLGADTGQLHIHLVARKRGDPGWPAPAWGQEPREPYRPDEMRGVAERLRRAI